MKPEASPGPPCAGIHRLFETNRLANGFQAQAYEEALPTIRRSRTGAATSAQAKEAWTETTLVHQGGVAA
jgi:hypothetical protein